MPSDAAAGGTGGGDGDAGLNGDLVGVGFDSDLDGFAGVGRPTWIFCPPTMTDPRTDTRRVTTRGSGRRGGWAAPGRAPRSRGRASGGTGQATVRTRTPPDRTWATGPSSWRVTRCPASGSPAVRMRSPRLTLPEALTVRSTSITSPCGRQRRRPGGPGPGCGEAGQVAGLEPGRQGLDAVAAEQDVDLAESGPKADGPPGHGWPEPDLLPRDPEVARRRDHPV